jgi:hypothetical protein
MLQLVYSQLEFKNKSLFQFTMDGSLQHCFKEFVYHIKMIFSLCS